MSQSELALAPHQVENSESYRKEDFRKKQKLSRILRTGRFRRKGQSLLHKK